MIRNNTFDIHKTMMTSEIRLKYVENTLLAELILSSVVLSN